MGKRWSYEIKKQAKDLHDAGKEVCEICEIIGVPYRTVSHWFSGYVRPPAKRWSVEMKNKCIELRKRGYTYSEVKEETGVPSPTQRGWYPEELKNLPRRQCVGTTIPVGDFINKNGLRYKIGLRGKVFYRDELGEWRRSNLAPEEVGFKPQTAARQPDHQQPTAE